MVKLLPLAPCGRMLPLMIGTVTLAEVVVTQQWSVAPFAGQDNAVSAALKDQIGVGLAPVNRVLRKGDACVQWFGHGTWLVRGDVALDGVAAVTDQTDAWAVVQIAGARVEDVLARLMPVDLRAVVFKSGHMARSMLGHMSVAITRVGPQAFEIMAMRSMAGTLVHELTVAMENVAARRTNF